MKILLCSPYYSEKENTTCGIANWTRNIMSAQINNSDFEVKLLPFDRSVDLNEESTFVERVISGIKDYLGLVLKVRKFVKEQRYDVVQVSTSAGLGLIRDYLIVKLVSRHNTKVVFHYHFGRMPEYLVGSSWKCKLMRRILKNSYASIVMDNTSFNLMKKRGYHVYYLPNPLSDQNLNKIAELSYLQRIHNQILFVGHVVPTKGVFELVKACSHIDDINLRIVGKVLPETKTQLMAISTSRNNGNWLEFIGEIPHDEVLKEMCKCDIFVLPTYTEGFPNVILESMACGCPIITCAVGAIPEMLDVDTTPCGIVIEPQNEVLVESAIRNLVNNQSDKDNFGRLAKKKIESSYTVDSVWSQLEIIWKQILS